MSSLSGVSASAEQRAATAAAASPPLPQLNQICEVLDDPHAASPTSSAPILQDSQMGAIAQLHAAAEAGDAESVSAAIAAGAPADALLNSQDHHRTALYKACCGGHAECAALLLKAGADPNAATDPDRPPNIGGRRPLHAAACCGDAECLSALSGPRCSMQPSSARRTA